MKRLIVPVVIALLAGIGGGSGYAYMSSSAPVAADSAKHDDSTSVTGDSAKVRGADSASATTDSTRRAAHPADLPPSADSLQHAALPLTPADSIRALQAARVAVKPENKPAAVVKPLAAKTAATTGNSPVGIATGKVAPAGILTPSPLQALPEQRLAKIFGAMQAKDAGRVLEQMTDNDIRTVLGMMSDRQAAAILSTLSPQRAAAITKGAVRGAGSTP